ncbi:MAG: S9 family peptidase, partial [Bacteroidetes bacterium]|nr:S9 family peptidase [Bacteroidota bacterium]
MKQLLLSIPGLLIVFLCFGQNIKEPVKVTDMVKIKSMNGLDISKDGSKAVFTVTSIEPDAENKWDYKYVNQVWMADLKSNNLKQLTTKENSSQALLSPDGKQIAFVRSAAGKPQIFLLSLDGGEAIQLTHFRYGASSPKWSPDGKKILFAASISLKELLKDSVLNPKHEVPTWPYEKPGINDNDELKNNMAKPDPDGNMEQVRAYLDNNVTDHKARVVNKLNFQDEMDVNPDISFTHFFITDVADAATPLEVTKGFYRYFSADFTPDGKQLIISGDINPDQHPDRSLEREIFIADADGNNLKKIAGEKGKVFSSPVISPSGKWLAFQYGNTSFVNIATLSVMPFNGSVKEAIDIPFDRNKGNMTWSADEKYIYFSAQSNGGQPLYRINISDKKPEQLTDFNSGIIDFSLSNNKIIYVKTQVADPFEIYASDMDAKNETQVTNYNDWVKSKQLSFPEKKSFTNKQGMTVEYWIMKPANYEAGKKYPLLLEIHGGPSAMWGPGETSMWHEYQYFCSKGYGVVYCNPRGSGGYGLDFLRANI